MQATIDYINTGVKNGIKAMIDLANKINAYKITAMEGYLILS